MSQEQLKDFMERVKEDKDIQEKLIALAVEYGFDVDAKDFVNNSIELDDDSLDTVAGGTQSSATEMPREVKVDMWV